MDPRVVAPNKRQANLSRLMKMKKASNGQIVNLCPFGCKGGREEFKPEEELGFITVTDTDEEEVTPDQAALAEVDPDLYGDLDQNGYCRHLIGFTVPGSKKVFERMGVKEGQRIVDGRHKETVKPGDKLVRITTSYRVYRDVDKDNELAELERLTAPVALTK